MLVAVGLILAAVPMPAQDGLEVPQAPDHTYTLHAYSDLVQVPTLVLNSLHGSYAGLEAKDFGISLDSGPQFRPRHVRVEGDDPITLAILLDDSKESRNELVGALDAAVSQLPLDLLTPKDHVSVLAFDCNVVRSLEYQPASNSMIQAGIVRALFSASLHADAPQSSHCRKRIHLWDAIAIAAQDVHNRPGPRVLLVITPGLDRKGKNTWNDVRGYADNYSIAIFGLRPPLPRFDFENQPTVETLPNGGFRIVEDPFGILCAGTGGISLDSTVATLEPQLRRLVNYVRGRYILEFSRAVNATGGRHTLYVATTDATALVRPSGVVVPVPDKSILNDPSTVPRDPSLAPVMGSRKVLEPH